MVQSAHVCLQDLRALRYVLATIARIYPQVQLMHKTKMIRHLFAQGVSIVLSDTGGVSVFQNVYLSVILIISSNHEQGFTTEWD